MIISDLSYLESVSEQQIEGGFNLGYDFSKIYFKEYFSVYKDVDSKVYVKGNLATAQATAFGFDTVTQTFTEVNPVYSNSVSMSATN
jgi:hypothetical protein